MLFKNNKHRMEKNDFRGKKQDYYCIQEQNHIYSLKVSLSRSFTISSASKNFKVKSL